MSLHKRVTVTIHRDLEHIATVVFEHELPILEAAHGEGSVRIHAELPPASIESVQDEFERLQRVYSRRNASPLAMAYPGGFEQVGRAIAESAVQERKGRPQAEPAAA